MATNSVRPNALSELKIRVHGDVNLDTLIVPVPQERERSEDDRVAWKKEGNCWRHRRPGGAWLLKEIIGAALEFEKGGKATSLTYDEGKNGVTPRRLKSSLDLPYLSSSAILRLYPKVPNGSDKGQVYRVERLLGWVHNDREVISSDEPDPYKEKLGQCLSDYAGDGVDPLDLLVFHDTGTHFRHLAPPMLEGVLKRHYEKGRTWIVWHMYSPLAEGNLWNVIAKKKDWLDRTVALVKGECLREAGADLPEYISLEQESENFVASMKKIPRLQALAAARHLIVHFHRQGVLHHERGKGLRTACYYCPLVSDLPNSRVFGTMVGFTSILVAAIVRGIAWAVVSGRSPRAGIIDGIKQGAVLDHLHYYNGYGDQEMLQESKRPDPYRRLFKALTDVKEQGWMGHGNVYYLSAVPLPAGTHLQQWNRIEGFIRSKVDTGKPPKGATVEEQVLEKGEEIATGVVWRGLEKVVLEEGSSSANGETPATPPLTVHCPFEVHGKIKTAYREEIESFSNVRRIIAKYLADERWKTPLSVAVFGPPGSGKSFTIRQILESVSPDIAKRPLEYNVSQFVDPRDLATAFHKVQDEAVAREVPLVFFDEFDANLGQEPLGWLKYFLSPMQDGKFKAGESMYRIGRAIFVFAGGVYKAWNEFYNPERKRTKAFKDAKGTDFVSRLRGHLDIPSINCPHQPRAAASRDKDPVGAVLMFRRAVLLRSLLELYLKDIIDPVTGQARVDKDVVRAFLKVRSYEHEARSMQAIIEMSRVSPRGRFQMSSLPAHDQLKMHVNAKEFYRLMAPHLSH